MPEPRRRGRPRGRPPGGGSERREAIVAAARELFAAHGFSQVSLRSIATRAGVDVALISHHFGSKERLFTATLGINVDPTQVLDETFSGPSADRPERVLRTFLGIWDNHRMEFAAALRSMADGTRTPPVAEVARTVIAPRIASHLTGEDADLRADLVASMITGLALQRYVVELEPLASASIDEVARWYAPALAALLSAERLSEPGPQSP